MQDIQAPNLMAAWSLETPEDSVQLYSRWAETYDREFAEALSYELPKLVARRFATLGGRGPVVDLGAGTGLVAEELNTKGISPCDGVDISHEMLAMAEAKGCYRRVFQGNILTRLPCETGVYDGCVSAGTFTLGHVGPEGLDEVVRILKTDGRACLSVHEKLYEERGFAQALDRPDIQNLNLQSAPIYNVPSEDEHANYRALLVSFTKV